MAHQEIHLVREDVAVRQDQMFDPTWAVRNGEYRHVRLLRCPAAVAPEGSFRTAMTQALDSVNRQQLEAGRMQREVQLDNPTVSLEETMVAMTRANLGFSATVQVRNRLVQAYTDIMNMQV